MNSSKFKQGTFDFEGYDEGLSNLNDTPDNEQDKTAFNWFDDPVAEKEEKLMFTGFDDPIIEERPKYTFKDKEVAWADPKDIIHEPDAESETPQKKFISQKKAKKLFRNLEKDFKKSRKKLDKKEKKQKKSKKTSKATVQKVKSTTSERLYSEQEVQLMTDNSRLRTENEYIKKRSDDAMKGVRNGIALGVLIASKDDVSKKYIADSIRFLNGDTYGQAFMIEGGDENV